MSTDNASDNAQAKFLTGSLFRHVTTMSLTASIGLMAIFLVDFADMVFISMLGKSELAAAVGYAGAILFFTSSFGIGMAISAGALVARALGQGDTQMASRRAATSMLYGVGGGAVFAAVIWLNLATLAGWVGATGETLDLAVSYLQIIVPALPLLIVGMIGGAILRAHGAARMSMMATIIAGVVNAVLDPILIFGLGLDLTGAALASVASRFAIAIASVYPIYRHYGGLAKPTPQEFREDFPAILTIAIPAILTQFATPLGQAFVTRAMAAYGEAAVAGMAIVGRLTPVSFAAVFALSGAIGPIIGQNAGAGDSNRVRGAFWEGMKFLALWIVAVSLILYLMRPLIAGLFTADGLTLTLLYLFCGPLSLMFFFNGVIFVGNAAFNNLGKPFWSTWVNWGRHTLGVVPFVWLGGAWYGAPGVLIGQYVGGVIFAVIAVLLARRLMREQGDATASESFARQGRLMALFSLRR